MKHPFLTVGDVFELKAGAVVYAVVPTAFVYSNRRSDPLDVLTTEAITIGRVYDNQQGDQLDTSSFCGRYVVEEVSRAGGGVQLTAGGRESVPNGYRVTASKLRDDGSYDDTMLRISFYQTAGFTASILPGAVTVVAKMRRTFEALHGG